MKIGGLGEDRGGEERVSSFSVAPKLFLARIQSRNFPTLFSNLRSDFEKKIN